MVTAVTDWSGHVVSLGGNSTDNNAVDDGALVLTGRHTDGTIWTVDDVDGWYGSAGSSISPTQKGRLPGSWAGNRQLKSKTMTISGFIKAPSRAVLRAAIDGLNGHVSLDNHQLTVQEDPSLSVRWRNVMLADGDIMVRYESPLVVSYSIQVIALDPRMFAPKITDFIGAGSHDLTLADRVGAAEAVDTTWSPGSFAGWTLIDVLSITNPGTYNGPLGLRLKGAMTGLRVVRISTGRTLAFDNLVLANNEVLNIDCELQLALDTSGNAAQNSSGKPWMSYLTRRGWQSFRPGLNQFAIYCKAFSNTATLAADGTPAWR